LLEGWIGANKWLAYNIHVAAIGASTTFLEVASFQEGCS
jgi:hypothetical protein